MPPEALARDPRSDKVVLLMSEEVPVAMLEKVQRYAERIDRSRILPRVRWNPETRVACAAG
jgi:hypothetical protein